MSATVCKTLSSLEETLSFGILLGRQARAADIITLEGPLGAGKTTLTQAIGKGLAVPADQYITSPTFSLMHEYQGRIPLYHIDLYRLQGEEEIEELGFEDFLYGDGMTVIEWPDRLGSLMPADRLHIEIVPLKGDGRRVTITCFGRSWRERISLLGGKCC